VVVAVFVEVVEAGLEPVVVGIPNMPGGKEPAPIPPILPRQTTWYSLLDGLVNIKGSKINDLPFLKLILSYSNFKCLF